MTKKLRKILETTWNEIGYECCIFFFLFIKFILFMPTNFMRWVPTYYAINYSYGFIPRGFIGTLFKLVTNGNITFLNAHSFAFIGTYILIILTSILFGKIIRSFKEEKNRKRMLFLTFVYFLMPFSICYLFNIKNFGRLDLYLYIITIIQILMTCKKQTLPKLLLCGVLSCICVMIHEGYALFIFPIFFIYLVYLLYKNKFEKKLMIGVGLILVLVGISTVYFNFCTNINIENVTDCVLQLRESTDLKINDYCVNYEYYKRSIGEHLNYFSERYMQTNVIALTVVMLLVLLPVNIVFIRFLKNTMKEEKGTTFGKCIMLMFVSMIVYVPLFLTTSDWGRWLAAVYNCIVAIIILIVLEKNDIIMKVVELPTLKKFYTFEERGRMCLFIAVTSYITLLGTFQTVGVYDWLYSIIASIKMNNIVG